MRFHFAPAALAAAALSASLAFAQMGPGYGPPGDRPMGPGAGGPGAMNGPGGGPGAMMHGHGHRGGDEGWGGRMGGMGGMGHGLAAIERLNLTDDQRTKVTEIRREMQRRMFGLMGSLREIRWKGQDLAKAPELDKAAALKLYDEGAAVRKQMFEAGLDARVQAEAILTKEQREQLHQQRPRAGRPPKG